MTYVIPITDINVINQKLIEEVEKTIKPIFLKHEQFKGLDKARIVSINGNYYFSFLKGYIPKGWAVSLEQDLKKLLNNK